MRWHCVVAACVLAAVAPAHAQNRGVYPLGMAFNGMYTDDTYGTISVVTADYDKKKTFDSVAPRFSIDYHVSGDTMAYFTLSRGFKSGGFNIRAQSNVFPESALPFKNETLDVAEVGIKSGFHGRLKQEERFSNARTAPQK